MMKWICIRYRKMDNILFRLQKIQNDDTTLSKDWKRLLRTERSSNLWMTQKHRRSVARAAKTPLSRDRHALTLHTSSFDSLTSLGDKRNQYNSSNNIQSTFYHNTHTQDITSPNINISFHNIEKYMSIHIQNTRSIIVTNSI